MICVTYICQQIYSAMLNMGIYYMIYILKNENLYSVFSWAINIPVIIAMCITPMLVEKMKGLYRMNLAGYILEQPAVSALFLQAIWEVFR